MMENEASYDVDSFDEDWWAALMSEEGVQMKKKPTPASKPTKEAAEKQPQIQNDWEFVQSLLDEDLVEECQVHWLRTGFSPGRRKPFKERSSARSFAQRFYWQKVNRQGD